jgi:hypothetical protein
LFRNKPPGAIQLIGTEPEVKILKEMVQKKGVTFTTDFSEIEPPPAASDATIFLETEGVIDAHIWRGVAKIVFNYLAKIEGARYVLDEKFDRIREFITGKRMDRALVRFSRFPILAGETTRIRYTKYHLVMYERNGPSLIGRVSLFNSFTYDVMLCENLRLIYSIKSGHAFDPVSRRVFKLVGSSRAIRLI